jgi:hypothetical protein
MSSSCKTISYYGFFEKKKLTMEIYWRTYVRKLTTWK